MKKSELQVLTRSKKLLSYIFQVTDKCPVKFRYTFVSKLQNLIMDSIELLYEANDLDLNDVNRLKSQRKAKTKLKLLNYIAESAKDYKCIKMKQYNYISLEIYSILSLIEGWINSDLKRKGDLV